MKKIALVTSSLIFGFIAVYKIKNYSTQTNPAHSIQIQKISNNLLASKNLPNGNEQQYASKRLVQKTAEVKKGSPTVISITEKNVEKEIYKSELPIVLDVYSTVCPPCQRLAPIIEELATEYQGTCKFCKLNIDENFWLANHYKITSLPTLLFIKNNEIKDKSGFLKKEQIQQKIATFLL